MAITQTITLQPISELAYKDTAVGILDTLINNSASPFNDMMDRFEAYLDKSGTDLDPTQKQAAYANMLKNAYADASKQAMQYAMDIHKTNKDLEIKKWELEASYNKNLHEIDVLKEQALLYAQQYLGAQKDNALKDEQIIESKINQAKGKAELKLQWGQDITIEDKVEVSNTDAEGVTTTTTTYGGTTITDTDADSVVKKQIRGYDVVNYKDVLKTLDERVALMQNAKIAETAEEKELRAELLHTILLNSNPIGDIKYFDGTKQRTTDGTFGNL